MSIYLSWEKSGNEIFDRKKFFFLKEFKSKLATKGLCWSCQIFDHAQQKCTHPELGCDTNKARIEPWENEVVCPKKLNLSNSIN